jgi:hypothetical protein
MPGKGKEIEMCKDCGIWKEQDKFVEVWPSDCHDRGGHYTAEYNEQGEFVRSDAPWQVGSQRPNLSQEEMARAQ